MPTKPTPTQTQTLLHARLDPDALATFCYAPALLWADAAQPLYGE